MTFQIQKDRMTRSTCFTRYFCVYWILILIIINLFCPILDELLMTFLIDCRWLLSMHCTWCLSLPRTTSSEILGAHPVYMVRYLLFCASGFYISSNMCIWGEGRNECTSRIKLDCTRLSLNYLSINLNYLVNNFRKEFLLLNWITALLHFQISVEQSRLDCLWFLLLNALSVTFS